jgi:hypothetical protein
MGFLYLQVLYLQAVKEKIATMSPANGTPNHLPRRATLTLRIKLAVEGVRLAPLHPVGCQGADYRMCA